MEQIKWSTWTVPYSHIRPYILLMIFALWFLPGVLGIRFTIMGYVLNYFWADFMFYVWYKAKRRAQIEWERRQKQRRWRGDDDESNRME